MLKELVDAYYIHRGYKSPDRKQALLFLLSEVGELADAYFELCRAEDQPSERERTAIEFAVLAGEIADREVSGQKEWVRNNDRVKAPDLGAEAGDVLMMLERFTQAAGLGDPIYCLEAKARTKGFYTRFDWQEKYIELQRKLIGELQTALRGWPGRSIETLKQIQELEDSLPWNKEK